MKVVHIPQRSILPQIPLLSLCEYTAPTLARAYRDAQESDMDCWDGIVALKKKLHFCVGEGAGKSGIWS